jgi:hypothetical protein
MSKSRLLCIYELAHNLGVPLKWLKRQADEGKIPFVQAGRRRFFDEFEVLAVLKGRSSPVKEVADE